MVDIPIFQRCKVKGHISEQSNLNFRSLQIVARYRHTQYEVTENVCNV